MTCHSCQSQCKRFGKHRNGLQRFRCDQCRKTFTEDHQRPLDEMRLPLDKAENVLRLLLEGMSVRSVERVSGVHRDTILRLLTLAGERCQRLMQEKIKGIEVRDVQVDEIWGYVYKKEGHKWAHEKDASEIGDAYCFVALDRDSKLVLTHHLGKRDSLSTDKFIHKLSLATGRHATNSPATGSSPISRPCRCSLWAGFTSLNW
jgi:transposase-like protein